jgi:hypothetical protein
MERLEAQTRAHDTPVPKIIIEFVKPAPFEFDRPAPDEPLDQRNKAGEDER